MSVINVGGCPSKQQSFVFCRRGANLSVYVHCYLVLLCAVFAVFCHFIRSLCSTVFLYICRPGCLPSLSRPPASPPAPSSYSGTRRAGWPGKVPPPRTAASSSVSWDSLCLHSWAAPARPAVSPPSPRRRRRSTATSRSTARRGSLLVGGLGPAAGSPPESATATSGHGSCLLAGRSARTPPGSGSCSCSLHTRCT